jgi:uncharacterized SAM-binding protein YcdF (DUF218 family)
MSYFLLSPLLWGIAVAAISVWRWSRAGRLSRVLAVCALTLCWLGCAPLGANGLVAWAESRVPASARCVAPRDAPIVVLAGGFSRPPRDAQDVAALTPESWRRLRAATDLQRRRGAPLWIAGGGQYPVKESEVMAGLARDWRVPEQAIHVDARSLTTRENALALRGRVPSRIILVSSAMHLPRAVQAFVAAGFAPCAVASGSEFIAPSGLGDVLPQGPAIAKSQAALHELVGAAAYRWRGAGAP